MIDDRCYQTLIEKANMVSQNSNTNRIQHSKLNSEEISRCDPSLSKMFSFNSPLCDLFAKHHVLGSQINNYSHLVEEAHSSYSQARGAEKLEGNNLHVDERFKRYSNILHSNL